MAALDEVPPNGKDPLARLKSAVAKIRQALDKGLDPTEVGLPMNQLTGTARQIAIEALEARPCGRP